MPTLLMVDEEDSRAQHINKNALGKIQAEKQLQIIVGAAHPNENLQALKQVADSAAQWFKQYLAPAELEVEAQLVESCAKR
jgi:hypothetical protein